MTFKNLFQGYDHFQSTYLNIMRESYRVIRWLNFKIFKVYFRLNKFEINDFKYTKT